MTAAAIAAPTSAFGRVWAAYLRQLSLRPLRTKMITSGTLFAFGDTIAQFGIEGRRFGAPSLEPGESDKDRVLPWDPTRALRLTCYGGLIFAPLAHTWLGWLDKIKYASKFKTLAVRLALDQCLWGPFIVSMFWSSNGVMEGKSPSEVKAKVEMAFVTSYMKSVCVFAPTQIVNFTIVPLPHRLAVQQTVGLGWNIFLSYQNNINNKRLAAAQADLAVAQAEEEAEEGHLAHVAAAQASVDKAQARKDRIQNAEGGGATGVGTRMGW